MNTRRSNRSALVFGLCACGLALAAGQSAQAQCAFDPPTNDVPLDLESGVPLAYTGKLGVFALFWAGDWDANPQNFRKADIEHGIQTVLGTPYFDRLCQYGVPGFHWDGSAQASSLCGTDPPSSVDPISLFSFMSCEEYTPLTGVPVAGGFPDPIACPFCDVAPMDCFFNPLDLTLDPSLIAASAACIAAPNPTADRVYVLFLPAGTSVGAVGFESCGSFDGFHFQIPSRALFSPLPPFVLPLTQGRPINIAIIPTACYTSVADLMSGVTHEVLEAATDPQPTENWIDFSQATGGGGFDLSQIQTLFTKGEAADICESTPATTFMAADGTTVDVANYWSNHDNACVSLDVTPPVTTFSATPSSFWANTNVLVTLNATDEAGGSGVHEIVYSASGAQTIAETHVEAATASATVTAEGITTLSYHAADNAGNVEASRTAFIRIDRTPPTIVATAAPPPNSAGWNNSPVVVSFACADGLSGVASCSPSQTLSQEAANQSATGAAIDLAGNQAQTTVGGINIDQVPPIITYTGNQGTYTVDLTVAIACAATDDLSGVAVDSCTNLVQDAYVLGLGTHTLQATATDVAGNTGSGTTSFQVIVTEASLCNLATRFETNSGIAGALCAKLHNAANANTPQARAGILEAFQNQVSAQSGKSLTAAQAATLEQLAQALL